MKPISWFGASVLSLSLLIWNVAPAEAAKGVKKGAEHTVHGTIVGLSGNMLVLKTNAHHTKKKGGQPARAVGNAMKLTVSNTTRVEVHRKGARAPGNLGMLHAGEHVVVMEHNHHADRIEIHQHGGNKGKKKKA